jgi:hypothetical protein
VRLHGCPDGTAVTSWCLLHFDELPFAGSLQSVIFYDCQTTNYRCAGKLRRRMRRRVRSRVLMSVRTAMRNFDLQLAIATLRLPAPSFMPGLN